MIFTSEETGKTVELHLNTKVRLATFEGGTRDMYVVRLPIPGATIVNDISVHFSDTFGGKEDVLIIDTYVVDNIVELL